MTSLTASAVPIAPTGAKTLANGQIIPGPVTAQIPLAQKVQGSLIDAASSKTVSSMQASAAASKALGAGQKGSGRTKRRRRKGGAAPINMNVPRSILPSGNSVPGVDATAIHKNATDLHNQLIADSAGDKLANAQAMQLGGRKKSKTRRVKKHHGRRSYRTYRRKHNISSSNRRRRNRVLARTSR